VTAQALADGRGTPDFVPQLAALAPVVGGADLALCHLEVPLARPGGPYAGYPAFDAPPELARSLAAVGYDGCSTASNHALDQGTDGVARTLDTLDAAGVRHAGTARTSAEAVATTVHDVHGVRVAHLSATFGLNEDAQPGDPWSVALLDPPAVLAAASRARAAGADVVVLSAHWGTENDPEPDSEQLRLAPELLASPDIDLVVGHHAHVVQPFERIGDEWVAYGLGNQLADQETPGTDDGVLARFTVARAPDGRWRVARAEYVPTWIDVGPPIRVRDVTAAPTGTPAEAARARTDARVATRGAPAAGLTRG
jgi:poly-gamma-glutamate synthesis protein (capsule biosynthesis protein)